VLSALLYTFIGLVIILAACAGYVAIFVKEEEHGKRAFAVLKHLGWLLFGSGGAVYVWLKLHKAGVI
jgi:hypothetical protein